MYLDSTGLDAAYLASYADREFDGRTDGYTPVEFPPGFTLIRCAQTVLPTWYVHPNRSTTGASLAYWKAANDAGTRARHDGTLGTVWTQRRDSDRWMTSYAGPIAQVAVQDRRLPAYGRTTTRQIVDFLTRYTRYENFFAYGNQFFERDRAPVVFVWPGNSQTDKVFFDAAQWWKVAEREGFVLVTVCEQYSNTSVSVSHRDSHAFYRQLRDGAEHPASGRMIPNYHLYGYGDLGFLAGDLWDGTDNALDSWARYHLAANGLDLYDVDNAAGERSGWHDRFRTWTWHQPDTDVAVLKLTRNVYRSHNTMPEESPLMWDFLKHYSCETAPDGTVVRYHSASAFRRPRDKRRL
ncbi:hypothetical protein SAMN05421812_10787 [Asanoa hainanensis]|uniref:Uncharacterized protein n=1 Tax=Asanoa hainanensis TaxID=560556 RepID=A0A239N1Q9_9ACTN|nr:hypothetical protein [Asanoa hainanensis]SNT48334.1 hypothetical protein SAMN05421812_10787 [Asanoa hainanensis]